MILSNPKFNLAYHLVTSNSLSTQILKHLHFFLSGKALGTVHKLKPSGNLLQQ